MEKPAIRRFLAIVTISTVRPRDFDGLGAAAKYYIDALRHIGIIEDDSPEFLEVITTSESCNSFEEEQTKIELYELNQEEQPE